MAFNMSGVSQGILNSEKDQQQAANNAQDLASKKQLFQLQQLQLQQAQSAQVTEQTNADMAGMENAPSPSAQQAGPGGPPGAPQGQPTPPQGAQPPPPGQSSAPPQQQGMPPQGQPTPPQGAPQGQPTPPQGAQPPQGMPPQGMPPQGMAPPTPQVAQPQQPRPMPPYQSLAGQPPRPQQPAPAPQGPPSAATPESQRDKVMKTMMDAGTKPDGDKQIHDNIIANLKAKGKVGPAAEAAASNYMKTPEIKAKIAHLDHMREEGMKLAEQASKAANEAYKSTYEKAASEALAKHQSTQDTETAKRDRESAANQRGELGVARGNLALNRDKFKQIQAGGIDSDLHGDELLRTLKSGEAATVKAIAEGREKFADLGYRGAERTRMAQLVNQYDPSFEGSGFQNKAAVQKDFTSGKSATNITAINTAIGHLGTLGELQAALKNGDVKKISSLYNRIGTETGKAGVNNVDIAKGAVGDELMRVFRQVGASETEAKAWQDKFNSAHSPETQAGALTTATTLLKSRIDSLNNQWKRGMQTDKDFPDMLDKHTKEVMSSLGVKPSGAQPATTGGPAIGTVEQGYKFKGGDPADKANWTKQ